MVQKSEEANENRIIEKTVKEMEKEMRALSQGDDQMCEQKGFLSPCYGFQAKLFASNRAYLERKR